MIIFFKYAAAVGIRHRVRRRKTRSAVVAVVTSSSSLLIREWNTPRTWQELLLHGRSIGRTQQISLLTDEENRFGPITFFPWHDALRIHGIEIKIFINEKRFWRRGG